MILSWSSTEGRFKEGVKTMTNGQLSVDDPNIPLLLTSCGLSGENRAPLPFLLTRNHIPISSPPDKFVKRRDTLQACSSVLKFNERIFEKTSLYGKDNEVDGEKTLSNCGGLSL